MSEKVYIYFLKVLMNVKTLHSIFFQLKTNIPGIIMLLDVFLMNSVLIVPKGFVFGVMTQNKHKVE